MRQALAPLLFASTSTLAGCSLLYNPNDLPARVDAMPDAEMIIDVNPAGLAITKVEPAEIKEGYGVDGSRRAIVVLEGTDILPNATVEITPSGTPTVPPMFTVDTAAIQVDAYGHHIAIPITLPVNAAQTAGMNIPLEIKVTQDGGGMVTLTDQLTIVGLDELTSTAPTKPLVADGNEYSRVLITTGTFAAFPQNFGPVFISSTSSIKIDVDLGANAPTAVEASGPGGPYGNAGGRGGQAGLLSGDPGVAGEGPAPGAGGGGGAGAFLGDAKLEDPKAALNRSSGGGGGNGTMLVRGGRGGGGGGSIVLTAGGDLTVGKVTANGANGEATGNPGGRGSGGVILLRAGRDLVATTLEVTGSNEGRIRGDAGGMRTGVPTSAYRGPAFASIPEIANDATPTVSVVGGANNAFGYFVSHEGMNSAITALSLGSDGTKTFQPTLKQGLNTVCLVVTGAEPNSSTRNCATIAHIFKE